MRVGQVTERLDGTTDITFPEGSEDVELVGATGRLQLMAKLAEGEAGDSGEASGGASGGRYGAGGGLKR